MGPAHRSLALVVSSLRIIGTDHVIARGYAVRSRRGIAAWHVAWRPMTRHRGASGATSASLLELGKPCHFNQCILSPQSMHPIALGMESESTGRHHDTAAPHTRVTTNKDDVARVQLFLAPCGDVTKGLRSRGLMTLWSASISGQMRNCNHNEQLEHWVRVGFYGLSPCVTQKKK